MYSQFYHMSKVGRDEQRLMDIARKNLAEVLGREPTRQELWRVHVCFKRMAFTLIDYIDHQNYEERKNQQDQEADGWNQEHDPGGSDRTQDENR